MTAARAYEPGEKTHRNENFPVASCLIQKKHRNAILAFYQFARAADDVADHSSLPEAEKIAQLDAFEATLLGTADTVAAALPLRSILAQRGLTPRHALDLLIAFRQDARKARYQDWDELMQYCAYSAAPVGRFVLDVHGESQATWPASDTLCAALQIINHLQDCKEDYLRLNRVYIPADALSAHNISEQVLAAPSASVELRSCLSEMARKTCGIITPKALSRQVSDKRLRLEIGVIERLADRLLQLLLQRDPLSECVHLRKRQLVPIVAMAMMETIATRAG